MFKQHCAAAGDCNRMVSMDAVSHSIVTFALSAFGHLQLSQDDAAASNMTRG